MKIVLTGSVAFDYLMNFPGYFRDHIIVEKLETISLSFLVESMVRLRGGNAPNIAYTLAMLGQQPCLFATVGEDFDDYRLWLESKGVDTTYARLIPGVNTASFFANTDLANAQIASFYPGAMAYATQLSLKELDQEEVGLVVISPNDPEAMKQYVRECQELGQPYIYDPSQQIVRLEADDIRQGVEGCLALFVNDYEFALISRLTGLTPSGILKYACFMVVTRGESGATVFSRDGEFNIPVVPPEKIADPTGVGDAFRGGFITGYQYGLDWVTCGRMGALAATYCLENTGPQGHQYTTAEFAARYRRYFDDEGKLDIIIRNPKNGVKHEKL